MAESGGIPRFGDLRALGRDEGRIGGPQADELPAESTIDTEVPLKLVGAGPRISPGVPVATLEEALTCSVWPSTR